MTKLHKSVVEKIRDSVDVQLLLDRYGLDYRVYGSNSFRLACPIHGGDNPTSFVFNNENKRYICFSRDCKGDVFEFIKELERCDFRKALEIASEIAGIKIDIDNMSDNDSYALRYSSLSKVVEKTMNTLRSQEKSDVNKPIDVEIMQRYKKYVPPSKFLNRWRSVDYSLEKDFDIGFGVLENDPIQTMRVIMPIHDEFGREVGLQGRSWRENENPKYCYYPTGLKKDRLVFNIHRIKDNLEDDNAIFITEGIFDVMNFWKYQIKNSVGMLGCKPSDEQINILTRYSNNFILCYDNDEAGVKGTKMFLNKTKEMDINILIFPIPKDKDDVGKMTSSEIEESLMNVMTPKSWLESVGK